MFYINWSVVINIEFCNFCMSLELTSSMYRWVLPTVDYMNANKQTNRLVYFRPICIIRDSELMSGTKVLVPDRGHLFQFVRVYKSLMC